MLLDRLYSLESDKLAAEWWMVDGVIDRQLGDLPPTPTIELQVHRATNDAGSG